MREICTSGSVGRAPGNRCLYPDGDGEGLAAPQLTFGQSSNMVVYHFLKRIMRVS
jgi:hypothetical protein